MYLYLYINICIRNMRVRSLMCKFVKACAVPAFAIRSIYKYFPLAISAMIILFNLIVNLNRLKRQSSNVLQLGFMPHAL